MFTPEINKDYILDCIPQERIFEYYLNVPVVFNRNFPSPFRKEKAPSCRFVSSYSGDRSIIRMVDYGRDNFHGDIFALVQKLFHTNFTGAVQKIAQDFGLVDPTNIKIVEQVYSPEFLKEQASRDKQYAKIDVKIRPFETHDLEFWAEFGILLDQLLKYHVFACKAVLLNNKAFYWYRKAYPCYAYRLRKDKKYKIYSPKNEKMKWLSNNVLMQGYEQLPETGDFLVITKSLKDVMLLDRLGIYAVAPPSETAIPPDEIMQDLISRFKKIVVLYDWDKAGIITSCNYRREYGLQPYFFTDGSFNTRDFGQKDLTDMYKAYGLDYIRDLVFKAKSYAEKGLTIPLRGF